MRIVKADRPDFGGKLSIEAFDSEGNKTKLPEDLTVEASSDNPSAIEISQDPNDQYSFTLHVGSPNADGSEAQANVVVNVLRDGILVGTANEAFTVTAGDPQSIVVGSLSFPDLDKPVIE